VRMALRSVSVAFRAWGAAATVTRTVREGDTIEFADRSWTVHHRPGHSPSDTVFHDAQRAELIAGDHLIKHISSNPLVSRPLGGGDFSDRPQALVIYMQSLAQTREMELARVLPGHGEEIHDHRDLIDERFRLHERRARKLLGLIAERPRTAYELAQAMWGNVAVTQAYLTLSEVLGHVDLLRNDGRVVEVEDGDGVARFAVS
jgi:glyoxylase-like metal-dependent hydrolase (beta-lactamase superfamily II)